MPKAEQEPIPAWIIEVRFPGREPVKHRTAGALHADEILQRFGLMRTRATVAIWPESRPDLVEIIHRPI